MINKYNSIAITLVLNFDERFMISKAGYTYVFKFAS